MKNKKTKIAIACQGGGSQTAFTAGVLQELFEAGIEKDFDVVSLSGTSGGAVCAFFIWYSLKKREQPVWKRLQEFWEDNSPHGTFEEFINQWIVEWIRAVNSGTMPTLELSPSNEFMKTMMGFLSLAQRPNYINFKSLLCAHADFGEIASWGPQTERPVLVLGAANVLTGKLQKFISNKDPIQVEHILASCAVPHIFPAVEIGRDAYWDGLFSDNPPLDVLIRPKFVGLENIAEEIWVIKINPTVSDAIPAKPDDIFDRRNQLEGNVSLFQQLTQLELINDMILGGAFKEEFLKILGIDTPIRIPKSFLEDEDKPYHIPCIEMSEDLQKGLDYESKIDRSFKNLAGLAEDGRKQARKFLADRAKVVKQNMTIRTFNSDFINKGPA